MNLGLSPAIVHSRRIFGACGAQPACARAFPSPENDFTAVFDELKRTPLEIATPAGHVLFDAERFMIGLEFTRVFTQRLPMIVGELRRGDRTRAARMVIGDGWVNPYFPLGHLVACGSPGPITENSIRDELKVAFHVLADNVGCEGFAGARNPLNLEFASAAA
jgi:hypothetical protein